MQLHRAGIFIPTCVTNEVSPAQGTSDSLLRSFVSSRGAFGRVPSLFAFFLQRSTVQPEVEDIRACTPRVKIADDVFREAGLESIGVWDFRTDEVKVLTNE